MQVLQTVQALRAYRRRCASPVGFVPTMGALHAGHLSLVDRAREQSKTVIVSIFVNPTQFGPNEDFNRYPRTLEDDLTQCEAAGVDAVFTPSVDEVYPPDVPAVEINVPSLTQTLEGERRPDHFQGVCRVVAKLFNMVQPDLAVFGRKDYQQLAVIQAMAHDLAMPIEIIPAQTLREDDGLAMSSRNRYLTPEQRPLAVGLYKALQQAKHLVEVEGEAEPDAVEAAMKQIIKVHRFDLDYAVVRHPRTLAPLECINPALTDGVVALLAARMGDVRLIDNMLLGHG